MKTTGPNKERPDHALPVPHQTPRKRKKTPGTWIFFWPISLFGNPGAESGVETLHDELRARFQDYKREPKCRLKPVAEDTKIDIWEYLRLQDLVKWESDIRRTFDRVRTTGTFPVFITGNHLGMLPVYKAYATDPRRICIVNLDAHLDVYDWTTNKERINHGNFLLHIGQKNNLRIINIGHRDLAFALEPDKGVFDQTFGLEKCIKEGLPAVMTEVQTYLNECDAVHIDLDVDVFDNSVMKGTGCPVPFGFSGQEVLKIITEVWKKNLVGLSISEYNNQRDPDGTGQNLLLWLLEFILLNRPCPTNTK